MNSSTMPGGCRSQFTATQWQELEHQALVFKYMMAGIPVPPDLLLFIRKSFETIATRIYHHPSSTLGYCSLYGKKIDPETGRCRRTDGKKWRCSKDAHTDSKYCERHMHRGRNRSRKPVETKTTLSIPPSPSSTVTVLTPTVSGNGSCYQTAAIPFQTHPSLSSSSSSSYGGHNLTQLQMDQGAFSYSVMGAKDYRYMHVVKSEEDAHRLLARASKVSNTWPLMASPVRNGSAMSSGSYAQQQHCFFGNEGYGASASGAGAGMTTTIKNESQSLRPFFDELPKPRDSWSGFKGERSNMNSTQLSVSIPITSSDFSATSSTSPNE